MGIQANVSGDRYPEQGAMLKKRVNVCFNYKPDETFPAVCIRDDMEEPFRTIFMLEDGRVVLATECQYQPLPL